MNTRPANPWQTDPDGVPHNFNPPDPELPTWDDEQYYLDRMEDAAHADPRDTYSYLDGAA